MALDWLIRVYTPAWLALASLDEPACRLSERDEVGGPRDLQAALPELARARTHARAAQGAGRAAAWSAGRGAAREAAWSSAGAAAWAAARVAVGDMAGDRARAMAREIAGDAAAAVAREAGAGTSRAAARDAARAALVPTLRGLERSAFALLDRMLPTVPVAGLGGRGSEVAVHAGG